MYKPKHIMCLMIIAFLYLNTFFGMDLQNFNEEQFFLLGRIFIIVKLVVVKILCIYLIFYSLLYISI